jgi:hypothetical protein
MNRTTRSTLFLASGLLLAGMTINAIADEGQFNKIHPRRSEVNQRLENQDKRIHYEVKEGKMSKGEAAKLHREDRHIRKEERAMAAKNSGHITKKEQEKLNRQENEVSEQIGK